MNISNSKAIILTSVHVENQEKELLKNTSIFKIAINQHAEDLNPHQRICSDYGVIGHLLQNFSQNIVTIRDWAENDRLIYAGQIPFKGSTIVCAVEYLIYQRYREILIVGDNSVHQDFFKQRVKKEMDLILQNNSEVQIFQYSQGNFNLPVKTVDKFLNERI